MSKDIVAGVLPKNSAIPEGWLEQHLHEIQEAQTFAVDDLPDEPAIRAQHLSLAQTLYARIGFLLSDLETFTLRAHATATLEVRRNYPDLTAEERRVVAKADSNYLEIRKLRDNVEITVGALKSKSFSLMNLNNNTLDPAMSSGRHT